jgi:hypothetical protein
MERGRPTSAAVCTGGFYPDECDLVVQGIGVAPDAPFRKEILVAGMLDPGRRPELGDAYAEEPMYNEVITAGPYVFTVGDWAGDYETGVDPRVKVPDWTWWGSEIRNEARFAYEILDRRLQLAGSSIANLVHGTVFLRSR